MRKLLICILPVIVMMILVQKKIRDFVNVNANVNQNANDGDGNPDADADLTTEGESVFDPDTEAATDRDAEVLQGLYYYYILQSCIDCDIDGESVAPAVELLDFWDIKQEQQQLQGIQQQQGQQQQQQLDFIDNQQKQVLKLKRRSPSPLQKPLQQIDSFIKYTQNTTP
ncbi:MAG: hypothetical protein EZS28_040185, partial [Streblomastix strix]